MAETTNNFYMQFPLYPVGSIVQIQDLIDPTEYTMCTIKKIDPDEIEGLYFYYLRANNEDKNIRYDPQIGNYFDCIENCNQRIELISLPVV